MTNNLSAEKNTHFYLVISEYPKSGGVWLTTLIGDILGIPKRDLYLNKQNIETKDTIFNYNLINHFWYENLNSLEIESPCVIKSHELPNSPLINFDARYIHLLRDGRDVVISKYFYEKDFCVKNGFIKEFNLSFEDHLRKTAQEWKSYMDAWLALDIPYFKYEDLLKDTKKTLINIFTILNIDYPPNKIEEVIADNIKSKLSKKMGNTVKHNTFVRKGIAGDWKTYFTKKHQAIFKEIAGDTLVRLGYEKDSSWESTLNFDYIEFIEFQDQVNMQLQNERTQLKKDLITLYNSSSWQILLQNQVNTKLIQEREQLGLEREQLRLERDQLKKELTAFYNSNSWRITRPLRAIKKRIVKA